MTNQNPAIAAAKARAAKRKQQAAKTPIDPLAEPSRVLPPKPVIVRHQNPVIDKNLRDAEAKRKKASGKPSIFGGIIAATFSKEKGMARYSKLIGAFIGSIIGVALSYLASRGLAVCSIVDGTETCSLWGMSQAQITGFLVAFLSQFGTWVAPPNSPLGGK